jgi:hypothetical protein
MFYVKHYQKVISPVRGKKNFSSHIGRGGGVVTERASPFGTFYMVSLGIV